MRFLFLVLITSAIEIRKKKSIQEETFIQTDKFYIEESQNILNKQMAISSIISVVNEKQRNIYFSGIKRMVDSYRQKIKTELFVQ